MLELIETIPKTPCLPVWNHKREKKKSIEWNKTYIQKKQLYLRFSIDSGNYKNNPSYQAGNWG